MLEGVADPLHAVAAFSHFDHDHIRNDFTRRSGHQGKRLHRRHPQVAFQYKRERGGDEVLAVRQDAARRLFHKGRAPHPQPGSDDEHRDNIPQQPCFFPNQLRAKATGCSAVVRSSMDASSNEVSADSPCTQLLLKLKNVEQAVADLRKMLTDQSTALRRQPFADSGPPQQRYHQPYYQQK